ncbi:ferritin family protein [Umezawaea sp. Da 62-37]|uniref:ferritin family protein n=1 Tax=Umezawaea sp. Da 62-37 TaxID=3075927 RepID=UPI0028F6CB5D|nr:ferritin family protein [Umezawaea sp. Da 62-37]WNV84997.1 ferritin family protein [Umezawaea sp. Da 62-37]
MTGPSTRLHPGLRAAFAAEAVAAVRYTYFAQVAEVEGHAEAARLFTDAARSAECAAHGHLDFLRYSGDPAADESIGGTELNVATAVSGALRGATESYPELVAAAHAEGMADVAGWLTTVTALKNAHTAKFERVLAQLTEHTFAPAPAGPDPE